MTRTDEGFSVRVEQHPVSSLVRYLKPKSSFASFCFIFELEDRYEE